MITLPDLFAFDRLVEIVDVGASYLEAPIYQPLLDKKLARLHLFEPDEKAAEGLRARYGKPHRVHRAFIGDGGPATFHETNWFATGSLYPPNEDVLRQFNNLYELVTPVAQHEVKTQKLDDVVQRSSDILKIDVQGAEYQIFEASPRHMSKTAFLVTEVNFLEIYKGAPSFADVHRLLERMGFMIHCFQTMSGRAIKGVLRDKDHNKAFRQMLWADAIYLPSFDRLADLSTHKILAGSAMLHTIGSLDFVVKWLGVLDRREGSDFLPRYQALLGK